MCHHPLINRSLPAAWGLRVEDTAPPCPRLHPTKLRTSSFIGLFGTSHLQGSCPCGAAPAAPSCPAQQAQAAGHPCPR